MSKDSFDEMLKEEQRLSQQSSTLNEQPDYSAPSNGGNKAKGTAIGIGVVVFFLAAVMGMMHFSKTDPPLCVACAGSVFLVFGTVGLVQSKINWDNWPIIIFPLLGLAMTALPIIDHYQKSSTGNTIFTEKNICGIISVSFFIAGVLMIIMPLLKRRYKLNTCTETITATCVYLDSHMSRSSHSHHRVYAPKWEYTVGGKVYEHQENMYTNVGVPVVGEDYEILVNPYDPNEIYRRDPYTLTFILVMGAIFLASGILIFYMGFLTK